MKKQVLCGALTVAAASFVAISAQGTEASAEMNANGISIDCEAQTMTLKAGAGDGTQLFVGTGKYTAAKKTLKVASWEIYDKLDDITVDLSKLNKQVENYVVVKDAPTGDPVIIKIAAADKTIAAAYDKATGEVKVTTGTGKAKGAVETGTVGEYRSSTSNTWATVTSGEGGVVTIGDISMYQRLGATLYYRVKAETPTCELKSIKATPTELAYDTETTATSHDVYEVKAFAGVEKKVTVAALAKGPKITVNYATRTATFVKDTEYRFIPTGATANQLAKIAYTPVPMDGTKVAAVEISADVLAKGGLVESRTAATAAKLASKVTQTYFNKIGTTVVADKKNIIANQTVTVDTGDLTLASDAYITKAGKTKGFLKVTLTNNSANKYEYVTVAGDAEAPTAATKVSGNVAAVNAKGKAGTKALTLAPGTKIYVRQVSVNPSKTVTIGVWSTDWAEVATIAAEPVVEPDTGDDGTQTEE